MGHAGSYEGHFGHSDFLRKKGNKTAKEELKQGFRSASTHIAHNIPSPFPAASITSCRSPQRRKATAVARREDYVDIHDSCNQVLISFRIRLISMPSRSRWIFLP
jgi:hypothetical protein